MGYDSEDRSVDERPVTNRPPVEDWTSDYDIFDPEYVTDPTPVWSDLRDQCPIAHTERWGGSWLPTRHADLQALAGMVPELSSTDPVVVSLPDDFRPERRKQGKRSSGLSAPPISADPPVQVWTRRMILPTFAPKAVERYRSYTEDLCHRLIDRFIACLLYTSPSPRDS